MKFNEDAFAATARVLAKHNSYMTGYRADEMVQLMKDDAQRHLDHDLGYCATRGYVLSAYRDPNGELAVTASVSPSLFDTTN